VFGALADPIRRGILARLSHGVCSVTELGEPFPVSAPAISKHLLVLERSGLIERWKEGRVHFCRLIAAPLQQAGDWIEQHQAFWERQLDALENYLNRDEGKMQGDGDGVPIAIRLRRYFRAPPEKVFRAWTQPDALKKWWCPAGWRATAIEVDTRVGGEYRIGMRRDAGDAEVWVRGHFLDVSPPQRLRYTWRWEGAFERISETLVTVEFARSGSGTELTLCHERFADAEVRQQHWIGWVAACNRLEASLLVG
jgi:uncharacterized protein YndB with AHSA1/START domain/DNA-binding transcriptional ArsR family regulator